MRQKRSLEVVMRLTGTRREGGEAQAQRVGIGVVLDQPKPSAELRAEQRRRRAHTVREQRVVCGGREEGKVEWGMGQRAVREAEERQREPNNGMILKDGGGDGHGGAQKDGRASVAS